MPTISLRIDEELANQIKFFAKEKGISVSTFLNEIIEKELIRKEQEKQEMEVFCMEAQANYEEMLVNNSGIKFEKAFKKLV